LRDCCTARGKGGRNKGNNGEEGGKGKGRQKRKGRKGTAENTLDLISGFGIAISLSRPSCEILASNCQLPNKIHGHFATPLEYVISLIR